MIELSLEQAKILLDAVQADRGHVFAHEFDVICSLMEQVKEAEAHQAPKPGPRFVVYENRDGNALIIKDTEKGVFLEGEWFTEATAQKAADDMNRDEAEATVG